MTDQAATLYARLGGYDAIAAVTNDLLPRLMSDPLLALLAEPGGRQRPS